MPVVRRKWITREMLRAEPDTLFVFGDNLKRVGLGGQAKEMRGEPNAIGLPTKRSPWDYLSDADFGEVEAASRNDIARLAVHIRENRTVVWPEDGIGTGLAKLQEKAPGIARFYNAVLHGLETKQRAAQRPPNYADLSPGEQWAIDKKLGILDWDGK
jgi:hypothetical protein